MRDMYIKVSVYLLLLILLLMAGYGKTDQEDYSQYVRKVWIEKSQYCPVSLMITQAEGGYIEGYVGENQAYEDIYFDIDWSNYRIPFQGTVNNGRAECMYYNEKEKEYSRLDITFCSENG